VIPGFGAVDCTYLTEDTAWYAQCLAAMRLSWLGNTVTGADPAPSKTPLFTGAPRHLPPCPPEG